MSEETASFTDEPPVREFADRGTLWLLGLPENMRGLLHLLAADIAAQLDFSRAVRINRSFIPPDLQKQEANLLYRVPFRQGRGEILIYLLLEHQSRPDRTMGLHLLSYIIELWKMQKREWEDNKTPVSRWELCPTIPIVFYTGKRRWNTPLSVKALMNVPQPLDRFVPVHDTLFLNLHATPPENLSGSAVAWALRTLQSAEDSQEALSAVLAEAVHYLESLPDSAQAEWRRALHYLLLLVRHKREPEERADLYEVVIESVDRRHAEEMEELIMTDAQVLMAQGRKEGREEGRIEGRREMLLEHLEIKFGPLTEAVIARVNSLSLEELRGISHQVVTAQALSELNL